MGALRALRGRRRRRAGRYGRRRGRGGLSRADRGCDGRLLGQACATLIAEEGILLGHIPAIRAFHRGLLSRWVSGVDLKQIPDARHLALESYSSGRSGSFWVSLRV